MNRSNASHESAMRNLGHAARSTFTVPYRWVATTRSQRRSERAPGGDARVVDDNVEPPVFVHRLLHQSLRADGRGHGVGVEGAGDDRDPTVKTDSFVDRSTSGPNGSIGKGRQGRPVSISLYRFRPRPHEQGSRGGHGPPSSDFRRPPGPAARTTTRSRSGKTNDRGDGHLLFHRCLLKATVIERRGRLQSGPFRTRVSLVAPRSTRQASTISGT